MIADSKARLFLRNAVAGVAVTAVLFLGLVGGLHVHGHHDAAECFLCLQLGHLGLEAPDVAPEIIVTRTAADIPELVQVFGYIPLPGNDPARAPPSLS